MVTTTKVLPSPFWQRIIKCFALREFESLSVPMVRPLPAMSEFSIAFNLNNGYVEHHDHPADKKNGFPARQMKSASWVVGVLDEFMGTLSFSGKQRQFTMEFTATGFYQIFGWSASDFTSETFTGNEVFGPTVAFLEEQLCEARTVAEMASVSEHFLHRYITKRKLKVETAAIYFVAQTLEKSTLPIPVEKLANVACMSMKSLERKFKEQVGVAPKYFSRIIRFNKALLQKMKRPQESWTSVAHDHGYFDQMHFIKDCKQFTGMTPALFLKHLPPPVEVANGFNGKE